MPFFLLAIALLGSLLLGELIRPKVRDTSKPASLKDFDFPSVDSSRSIPVVWGTVLLDSPIITWYGDLQTVKLTKRVKTGIFSSDRLTLGFRYSLGLQFTLCQGPLDILLEVRTDNIPVFYTEDQFETNYMIDPTGLGQDFDVDSRRVYGGDSEDELQNGGEGGVYARCTFHKGSSTQVADDYLEDVLGTDVPGNRDIASVMWQGPNSGQIKFNGSAGENYTREPFLSGYVGNSPNLKPMSFVVRRCPSLLTGDVNSVVNRSSTDPETNSFEYADANPVEVIYEILVNDLWGAGIPSTLIDFTSFVVAAETVYNESIGFSAIWDSPKEVNEIIDDILAYIDGVIYTDILTGLITIKLVRNDYVFGNLAVLNATNVVEVTNFSKTAWNETTNEVRVNYTDWTDIKDGVRTFRDKTAIAQDLANQRIQGLTVTSNVSYIGLSNPNTASKIAYRDLRNLTIPLIKISLRVRRSSILTYIDGADTVPTLISPGEAFKFTWPEYGLNQSIFRVARISFGQFEDNIWEVEAIQDVFSLSTPLYSTPGDSDFTSPVGNATTPTTYETIEAPYFFSGNEARLLGFCAKPDTNQLSFNTLTSVGSSGGTYTKVDEGDAFTPTGTLDSSYPEVTSEVSTTDMVITPTSPNMLTFLQSFGSAYIATGQNMILVSDGTKFEIMAFETVTPNSPTTGKYTLDNLWRGLLDTTPVAHASGSRVWFLSYGGSEPSQSYSMGNTVYTKFQSMAGNSSSSVSSFDTLSIVGRSLKPYPPGNVTINSSTSTTTLSSGSDIVLAWAHRNRLAQAQTVYKQFATGLDPEQGTEYFIKFFNASNTLLRTVGPLSTTTYTYTNALQTSDNGGSQPLVVTYQLYSKREGLFSFQAQQRTLLRTGGTAPSPPAYSPGSDSYNPIIPGSASSISEVPISQSAPSNTQVLTYNSTSGQWEPQTPIAPPFSDADTLIRNASDATKLAKFNAAPIATATTRTYDLPNANGTLALIAATQTITNKTLTGSTNTIGENTVGGTGAATGDIWYRSSGGIFTRLGIGSTGQILKVASGLPAWQNDSPSTITIADADGSPSFSDISTLEFDSADGLIITNPSAGVARVDFSGGGGSGDSTTTAPFASRPSAGNDGNIFLPSDGYSLQRDNGSAWQSWGPIFAFTKPPAVASWTWVNQASATATDTADGVYLSAPNTAGPSTNILKKSAPSTPYTITAAFIPNLTSAATTNTTALVSLLWRDSSSGKIARFGVVGALVSSTVVVPVLTSRNSPGATSANDAAPFADRLILVSSIIWLQLIDDGTNRKIKHSSDGQNWLEVYSVGRTTYPSSSMTPDEVGISIANTATSSLTQGMLLLSWKEA